MSQLMYHLTGVAPPRVDPGALEELAATWESVRSAAVGVGDDAKASVNHVLAHNEGAATDDFERSVLGANSSIAQLEKLADAASRTRDAHRQAAAVVAHTRTAMDAVASAAASDLWQLASQAPPRTQQMFQLVARTRADLTRLSGRGGRSVAEAYDFIELPGLLALSEADARGAVHPDVATAWAGLDEQEQMALLLAMADDITADWDGDPVDIQFFTNQPPPYPPGVGPLPSQYADSANSRGLAVGNEVYMNYDLLGDSDGELIHTMAHELRHVRQNRIENQYDSMGWIQRVMVEAGVVNDPFAEHGSNIHQAERFHRGSYENPRIQDRNHSGDYYTHRPREVDARRGGTEYVDHLGPDELQRLADEAGVTLPGG